MAHARPHILIVEDEWWIAMDLADTLKAAGYQIAGPACSARHALHLIGATSLRGAVLDINLGEETVWPVAEALDACDVPFILVSGYSDVDIPSAFKERKLVRKPASPAGLIAAVKEIGVPPAEAAR